MLSKLLKYEIKATARIFLPLFAVLLIFAGVNKSISSLSQNKWQAPEVISFILYITVLVGILVMTLIVMIQRFYKNLLTDEGYLMFTLPAKAWQHITSKLIVAMMWTVVSSIVAIISILIITFDVFFTSENMQAILNSINEVFKEFGASAFLVMLEILLVIIVSMAACILMIYASIALGQLFNRHRILASLGAFIVLNTVSQILFMVAASIPGGMNLEKRISSMNEFFSILPVFHSVMWYCILFFGVLSVGYFALSNYILKKRLNLE